MAGNSSGETPPTNPMATDGVGREQPLAVSYKIDLANTGDGHSNLCWFNATMQALFWAGYKQMLEQTDFNDNGILNDRKDKMLLIFEKMETAQKTEEKINVAPMFFNDYNTFMEPTTENDVCDANYTIGSQDDPRKILVSIFSDNQLFRVTETMTADCDKNSKDSLHKIEEIDDLKIWFSDVTADISEIKATRFDGYNMHCVLVKTEKRYDCYFHSREDADQYAKNKVTLTADSFVRIKQVKLTLENKTLQVFVPHIFTPVVALQRTPKIFADFIRLPHTEVRSSPYWFYNDDRPYTIENMLSGTETILDFRECTNKADAVTQKSATVAREYEANGHIVCFLLQTYFKKYDTEGNVIEDTLVEYENLDLWKSRSTVLNDSQTLELKSVICRSSVSKGTSSGGHYVCYIPGPTHTTDSESWILLNDLGTPVTKSKKIA